MGFLLALQRRHWLGSLTGPPGREAER
jgi:hypothetical protein